MPRVEVEDAKGKRRSVRLRARCLSAVLRRTSCRWSRTSKRGKRFHGLSFAAFRRRVTTLAEWTPPMNDVTARYALSNAVVNESCHLAPSCTRLARIRTGARTWTAARRSWSLICHDSSSGDIWVDYHSTSTRYAGSDVHQTNSFCLEGEGHLEVGDFDGDGAADLLCFSVDSGTKQIDSLYSALP